MRTLTSWVLAGALAASLSWNWTLLRRTAPTACEPDEGTGGASCTVAAGLDLDPPRRARLAEICARSCGASDTLEARANALQRELLASLAEPEVDAAATDELVTRVADLRRRSLAACIEGILGVRSILSPDEVRRLLESCGSGPGSCR